MRRETDRLVLSASTPDDLDDVLAFRRRNAERLARWEPLRPEGWDSVESLRQRLEDEHADHAAGRALVVLARVKGDDDIVARAAFTNIVRGPFLACSLGYAVDGQHEGTGLMRETLEAAIDHVFGEMGLHRVMANHLPENERSAALLARLGFEREGYARDYLQIAGRWRDHVLTSKLNPADTPSD